MRKRAPKPVGQEDLGHVVSLDPTCKQASLLARAVGCSRFAYNWGLAEWERQYRSGQHPSANNLKKQFNSIRGKEFPWSYESPRDATSQPFADLGSAFSAFFASLKGTRKGPKMGHPTPRKRGQDDSFYVANDKFHIVGDKIYLPKIGPVRMREELRLPGKILCARVFRKAGRWYASVQVQGEFRRPTVHERPIIGVDLGVKVAVMPSQGEPIEAPKPLAANLKQLRRANRRLHRRQKGSKNRYKAQMSVARLHQRIGNVRRDWAHKVTTKLTRENQAVVFEDLNVSGMLRNERLARAISDVGFGMIRQFATYKGRINDCEIKIADRYFPSSKRCHRCGNVKAELSLSERVFRCENCGLVEDRDLNAALNLEAYPGLRGNAAERRNAWGDGASTRKVTAVRASAVVEPGTNP